MKKCKRCGKEKENSEFGMLNSNSDKLNSKCKECMRTISRGTNDKGPTPIGIYNALKRRSAKRGITMDLTFREFTNLLTSPCYYCGSVFYRTSSRIGIDRMDSTLGYSVDNSVSACPICNIGKYLLSPGQYIEHCKKVAEHNKYVDKGPD